MKTHDRLTLQGRCSDSGSQRSTTSRNRFGIVGYDDVRTVPAGSRNWLLGSLLLLLAIAGFAIPTGAFAQGQDCLTDTLRINTGWNHATNSLDPIGSFTQYWRVIADPSPNTTEPRPASVILKHPAWAFPFANTQWISSYPSSTNDTNGTYSFELCFCLAPNAQRPVLELSLLADDSATVYLNGNLVGATNGGYTIPTPLKDGNPAHFVPGKNCIRVDVHNLGNVAMGFDLRGQVVANGVGLVKPHCCDSTGSIIGMKFWDQNCNGKHDAGEPGLPGWKINLSNGWSAITDALGNYYFMNVPTGTYTVTETNQAGWTQTYPAGSHIVTVGVGQVVSNIEFGNCRKEQKDTCLFFGDQSIKCVPIPGTNQMGYSLTAWIKSNLLACGNQQSASITSVSPAGITVTPGSFSLSPTYQSVNFTISGPGATPGTDVSIVIQICCVDPTGHDICCSDTLKVRLPECPQEGCFKIVEQRIDCKQGPNGTTFSYCFAFLNQSNFTAHYFAILTPPGVTITPNPVLYPSGVPVGGVSPWQCVTISGPNATPGSTHTFYVRMCDKQKQRCCTDSFRITLPECPKPIDCCKDFTKRFAQLANSASANGSASVSGILWASGSGGAQIISASATLVSVSVNGQPAWGSVTSGFITGLGAGFVPPPPYTYPYSQDISWGPSLPVSLMGSSFNIGLKFQPMAPKTWKDVIRYCIRFRFTDKNCVTCDTVICFTRVRYKIFFPDWIDIRRPETKKHDGASILGGSGAPISGTLAGSDSATLEINFPAPPEGVTGMKYLGMTVTPLDSNVEITTGTTSASGYDLFFAYRGMLAFFEADPGNSVSFGLKYNGFGNRAALPHRITFTYTVDGDTVTDELDYTFHRASSTGGDQVTAATSALRDVRTYAIHLRNANGSEQAIDRLVLDTRDGEKIVAVGPTANGSQAVLQFGASGNDKFAGEDMTGGAITVAPGAEHGPIYLTLAGVAENTTTIHFATLDANGQVITEGDLTLSSPLSSVENGDDDAVAGAMLRQSYPNPASHSATIGFALPAGQDGVSLMLSDASGQVVARLIDGEALGGGEHAVYVDTSNLPSGTYYYTLRAGTKVETRSMQVVK